MVVSIGWECALLIPVAAVSFWGMSVVAEYRFVPTLLVMSRRLRIPSDVAGATLMAIGASSPELFSNVIAVFITKSDLGIGTIIGSEIFNHMIILAGVCWSRDEPQKLDRLTTLRDIIAYGVALGLLLLALNDVRRRGNKNDDDYDDDSKIVVRWYAPIPLFLWYGAYVFACSRYGRSLLAAVCGKGDPRGGDDRRDDDDGSGSGSESDAFDDDDGFRDAEKKGGVTEAFLVAEKTCEGGLFPGPPLAKAYGAAGPEDPEEEPEDLYRYPDCGAGTPRDIAVALLDAALLPLGYAMDRTLVEPADDLGVGGLAWNAGACTAWLVAFSFAMVFALETIGDAIGISPAVMGLTVGAIGTSFPNLVSSMVAAKKGAANMAVANALGSNVFNLCVCIALPWLVYPCVFNRNYDLMHDDAVVVNVGMLLIALAAYALLMSASSYTLKPLMGWGFSIAYVTFLVVSLLAGKQVSTIENKIQGGN